jgi:phosphatidate cytidylyltransferase
MWGLGKIYEYTNEAFILWIFSTIWITDTGAFFFGKLFGRRLLAPKISPKKTWEGAVGGTITSVASISLVSLCVTQLAHLTPYVALLTFIMSVSAHVGDLLESAGKRLFDAKDSGNIIPGHGGLADRFDSVLFTCIVLEVLLYFLMR